jgi:hypothetical protein
VNRQTTIVACGCLIICEIQRARSLLTAHCLSNCLHPQAKDLHQCFDPNAEVAELGADVRIKQLWYDLGVFLSC